MTTRLIYMGTPEFAIPALKMLAGRTDVEVSLVVTQPDRPSGRGRKMQPTPVAQVAERLDLPVYRVGTLRTSAARCPIVHLEPELIIVAAFGAILGTSILQLPPLGCVNLHASLLPAYRGANPIAAAIREGAETTGVTLMRMERGLDTGPLYAADRIDINDDDTTASLTPRLAEASGHLLDAHLTGLFTGTLLPEPQSSGATCTRLMTKDDGWIDWRLSAVEIERHVRAMWVWPRAWTTLPNGERLQVHRSYVIDRPADEPGVVTMDDDALVVSCSQLSLQLETVQLAGGKPRTGASLVSRGIIASGDSLGMSQAPRRAAPLVVDC